MLVNRFKPLPVVDRSILELKRAASYYGCVRLSRRMSELEDFQKVLKHLGSPMHGVGQNQLAELGHSGPASDADGGERHDLIFESLASCDPQPTSYGALQCTMVPQNGAAIVFTDQFAASDSLPPKLKTDLEGAQVLHWGYNAKGERMETWQPLFRLHPVTKRFALFLGSPQRMRALRLTNGTVATHLLKELYDRSVQDHAVYRHTWAVGDVIVWDNRCTLHALDKADGHDRLNLNSGYVRGETPLWR